MSDARNRNFRKGPWVGTTLCGLHQCRGQTPHHSSTFPRSGVRVYGAGPARTLRATQAGERQHASEALIAVCTSFTTLAPQSLSIAASLSTCTVPTCCVLRHYAL